MFGHTEEEVSFVKIGSDINSLIVLWNIVKHRRWVMVVLYGIVLNLQYGMKNSWIRRNPQPADSNETDRLSTSDLPKI